MERRGRKSGRSRIAHAVLAFVLALSLCPAPNALAADVDYGTSLTVSSDPSAQADEPIDLNAAWSSASGLSADFTITKGGTYLLTSDLEAGGALTIDADGQDVVLRLDGYKLTLNGTGSSARKTMLSIVAAKSVTIDGSTVREGACSTIESAGEADVRGIASSAEGCALAANDVTVRLRSNSTTQRMLSTHAICIASGTLKLDRCTVLMEMGNQTLRNSLYLADQNPEVPSAVYATGDVRSVELVDCSVTGEGVPGFALDDIADATTIGNAYAVYSLAKSTKVAGGSYKAVSLLGNATCLYGTVLEVTTGSSADGGEKDGNEVKLEADAGQIATGILSRKAKSVTLGVPVEFKVGDDYVEYAQAEAALRSSVANGFVFGDCASAVGSCPVLIMTGSSLSAANKDGTAVGTFASGLSSEQTAAVASILSNALPDGACDVVAGTSRAVLRLNVDKAPARIGENYYSTIDEAVAALTGGATLTLLKDVGPVVFSKSVDADIDLNGHEITSFATSGGATGKIITVRNGAIGGPSAGIPAIAVSHSSKSSLVLEDVAVRARAVNVDASGVYAEAKAGALTIKGASTIDVGVSCTTLTASAYGIYILKNGSALDLEGTVITAHSVSAGAGVYGVFARGLSTTIDSAEIHASGATGSTFAAYVYGTLSAKDSAFDAYTTGIASAAAGIGLATGTPYSSNVVIDGCTVTVRSAVSPDALKDANYFCLLGSMIELTGTAFPTDALTLSGENVFQNVGGVHMGLNLGNIVLGADFSLGESSDAPLVVSQAKKDGDVGFTFAGATTATHAQEYATLFEPRVGSYYEGWRLVAGQDGSNLVWHPGTDTTGTGVVEVRSAGSGGVAKYRTLADALSKARSSDTVTLLADLDETGAQTVKQDDLVLDLNGHVLTLRGAAATGGVLSYAGSGTLDVKNGTLTLHMGKANETAAAVYQGITVAGGGTLHVGTDAIVRAAYTGGTSSLAQRDVTTRGITVTSGALRFEGSLEMTGASADGAVGAMTTCGVFAEPSSGKEATIDVAESASVKVEARTGVDVTMNNVYAENTLTQAGPFALREISVDPENDAEFYSDLVRQFRLTASYDDPDASTRQRTHGASIYYAQGMILDHEGAWYDGLYVWAFSDEVAKADVGKMESIVPSHVFIGTASETLPNVYGVATGTGLTGTATVSIRGLVSAESPHGNAYAIDAKAADGGVASWTCKGADLRATGDGGAHPIAQGNFDLRDYIEFTSEQPDKVNYSIANALIAQYEPAEARCAVIDEGVSLTFFGKESFTATARDAASVEASTFAVGGDFSLASDSQVCSVANPSGSNAAGAVFAVPVEGASIRAGVESLFEDAYGARTAGASGGGIAWTGETAYTVTFMSGEAVVARYVEPTSIDLSEPSQAAARPDDQRQNHTVVGWSEGTDENATSGYLAADAVIEPTGSKVYHAVYGIGLVRVPIVFTNVFDSSGNLQPDTTIIASYGQTVDEALDAAGAGLPVPSDYTDASGTSYRFVGWLPYTSAEQLSPLLYSDESVKDIEVTLAANGVSSGNGLTLRATYLAVEPGQHLVIYLVDGYVSACAVNDGERAVYTVANAKNTYYTSPVKQDTETGKGYVFDGWFEDGQAGGEVNGALDGGEILYDAIMPRVYGDVAYTAAWSWKWSDVTYSFYVKYYDEAANELEANGVRIVNTTCETPTQRAADSVAAVGSTFSYGGRAFRLAGWSTRSTDKEPLYDENNPLPDVTSANRSLTQAYSQTFYAVYSVVDHAVTVSFVDGSTTLATATVPSMSTVAQAFSATGVPAPQGTSSDNVFLGWAKDPGAKSAINDVSTSLDSLVPSGATELTLYAVYGAPPVYRVRLRTDDGSKTLYDIKVRKGSTVNSVLSKAGVAVDVPAQKGSYFFGWCTAAGAIASLDDPVTGALDLFRIYRPIEVSTKDADDISAVVSSASPRLEGASSVSFSIRPLKSADSPLRHDTAKSKYTILKSYAMRLTATASDGTKKDVSGDFGTASFKIYVGTAYRNAKVRAFWLGNDNGRETVLNSAVKDVDAKGYITLSIGNYGIGDEDEGGNLTIAYIEGGSSGGKLDGGDGGGGLDENKNENGGSGSGGLTPGGGGGLSSGGTSGSGLSGGSLSGGSLSSGSLSSGGLTSGGLSGALASGTALSSSSGAKDGTLASDLAKSSKTEVSSASDSAAGSAAVDTLAEGVASESGPGVNVDLVILILILLALAALAVWGIWRFLAARRKRSDEDVEDELPSLSQRYADGLPF